MCILDIIQEILEEFFNKLKEDKDIPDHLTSQLKHLWNETKFESRASILNLIKEGFGKDFED